MSAPSHPPLSRGSLFSTVLRILPLALAFAPWPALAGPAESSVWIDVSRERGVRFNGYRLPREAEGMGVVMAPAREIATAAHVVWQAESITITNFKGAKSRARVVCIDKAADIALLRVERPPRHFATIRARPAVTGEWVGVVERPEPGEAPNVASGAIGATRWTVNGVPVALIFSGIKGEKGMSGGGLFDAAGDLLGIVIRIDGRFGYLSALPVAELCTRFSRCAGGGPPAVLPQGCDASASQWPAASQHAPEPRAPLHRAARREQ
jgi:S1-C subfamily serine protease